ncbi:LppP/LprE family lipoprotein [Corynebacterium pseudopelargi]|uniref:LppP/LprE lipoprotein n=1 Tax=Corynebacterium pseudopelargi TaxID=2080757 RepID=A0A3G6IYX5_9CORY|nr:LppP/LprE family lipoprotein [Corynebacterium pseudopelargi]AZA09878.1 hypothetical protein CPPEL_08875 [Corynebacterium pseudopelargi]
MRSLKHAHTVFALAASSLLGFSLTACITPSSLAPNIEPNSQAAPGSDGAEGCSSEELMSSLEQHSGDLPRLSSTPWAIEQAVLDSEKPCAELSYALIPAAEGRTVSTPMQVALFHNGEFIGPASEEIYSFAPEVNRLSDSALAITYRFRKEGESAAESSGRTTVAFEWDPDSEEVLVTGHFPPSS